MFPHPLNSLTAGAENSPKFSANFSLFGSKGKLAELFGYYCYSNNSIDQQKEQEKKLPNALLDRRHFGSDSRCGAIEFSSHF